MVATTMESEKAAPSLPFVSDSKVSTAGVVSAAVNLNRMRTRDSSVVLEKKHDRPEVAFTNTKTEKELNAANHSDFRTSKPSAREPSLRGCPVHGVKRIGSTMFPPFRGAARGPMASPSNQIGPSFTGDWTLTHGPYYRERGMVPFHGVVVERRLHSHSRAPPWLPAVPAARAQDHGHVDLRYQRSLSRHPVPPFHPHGSHHPRTNASGAVSPVQLTTSPKSRNATILESLGATCLERRMNKVPYFDASRLDDPDPATVANRRTRGGVTEPFPEKVHRMLSDVGKEGLQDIVSFYPHGRAFGIHQPKKFATEVMPKYFKQSQLSSFQRQLNLYGFTRINAGPDAGGYYHELFLRGRPALSIHIRRVGIPQAVPRRRGVKAHDTFQDPDFYSMAPIVELLSTRKGKKSQDSCEGKREPVGNVNK